MPLKVKIHALKVEKQSWSVDAEIEEKEKIHEQKFFLGVDFWNVDMKIPCEILGFPAMSCTSWQLQLPEQYQWQFEQ